MEWKTNSVTIRIEASLNKQTRVQRYRLWDHRHEIPAPSDGVITAEIQIDGYWEEMRFNDVWGRSQFGGKGAWLKQKESRRFSAPTGDHTFPVRFRMAN